MRKAFRIKEAKHWKNGIHPPKDRIKNITGTFIYQMPPDYPGVPSLEWKTREWLSEFQRLKTLGFDTVIHSAAISETTTGNWHVLYDIPKESLQAFKDVLIYSILKMSWEHFLILLLVCEKRGRYGRKLQMH